MDRTKAYSLLGITILGLSVVAVQYTEVFSDPTYSEDTNTTEILQMPEEMENYRTTVDRATIKPETQGEGINHGDVLKQHYREFKYSIFSALENGNYNTSLKEYPETVRVRIVIFRNSDIAEQQAQAFLENRPVNSNITDMQLKEGVHAKRVEAVVNGYEKLFIISKKVDNLHFYVSTKTAKEPQYVSDDKAVNVARKIYNKVEK